MNPTSIARRRSRFMMNFNECPFILLLILSLPLAIARPCASSPHPTYAPTSEQMVQLSSPYLKTLWWILAMRRNFRVLLMVSSPERSEQANIFLCFLLRSRPPAVAFCCHHFSLYCVLMVFCFAQVFTGLIIVMEMLYIRLEMWIRHPSTPPARGLHPSATHPLNYFLIISRKNNRL